MSEARAADAASAEQSFELEPEGLKVMPGTPGLEWTDVVHLMIPGRGRSADGMGLSEQTSERVRHAVKIYERLGLWGKGGRIICSGYKTPGDTKGDACMYEGERFTGKPEAVAMKELLIELGIPEEAIAVEYHSIDTAMNFVRSEQEHRFGKFGPGLDYRPVGIIAQEAHLQRMLKYIAPKTLQRRFMGIIAPEADDKKKDADRRAASLESQFVLAGVSRHTLDKTIRAANARAEFTWAAVLLVNRVLRRGKQAAYHTDAT